MAEITTAILNVAPAHDERVVALQNEVKGLLDYAKIRTIVTDKDVSDATNDLSLMSSLKKAIEEKRREYVDPLNTHLKTINDLFKTLSEPLSQADRTTREKVLAYRAEIERKRKEAEEINRQKEELARREAALNHGEVTIDTTPIVVPTSAPETVRTDAGTLGTQDHWIFEVTDFGLLPNEYKIVDSAKLGKVVRAGLHNIPGVRIWNEPVLKITTAK
jgi:hypothetical protein